MNALFVTMLLAQTATALPDAGSVGADQPAATSTVAPAAPATVAQPTSPSTVGPGFRLHVGAQVGLPIIFGVGATGTFFVANRPRFDVDAWWEPSGFLQSYSIGAAWRPADRFFFVGARVRVMQFQPPWTKGFNGANDNHLGLGLEGGVRLRVGPSDRGLIAIALGGTFLPTQSVNLQWLIGLTAGFSWGVWER